MFSTRKRYTFSERLARRERRRRRTKQLMLLSVLAIAAQLNLTGARQWVDPLGGIISNSAVVPDTQAAVIAPEQLQTPKPALGVPSELVPHNHPVQPFARLAKLDSGSITAGYQQLEGGRRGRLTIDPRLQKAADEILSKYRIPWGAVVAIEPSTGRVLALSSYSAVEPDAEPFALRGGMPAASLFKVVTAAAAVETAGMTGASQVRFRGGNYTLNKWNYRPDARRDLRRMTLRDALAKSCNPVFGRVAVQSLSYEVLERYAKAFGFNYDMQFELPVVGSTYAPIKSKYELARTGAGFGEALISPLHAAMIVAAVANNGVMMRPMLIDAITDSEGGVIEDFEPHVFSRPLMASTAERVLHMLEETVESGTARRQFSRSRDLRSVRIAAKTGTLSGDQPAGRYHWLVAAFPAEKPQIALASIVVDPGNARINGTALGRLVLEKYFSDEADS